MSPITRNTSALYFLTGLLCGVLIGLAVDRTWTGILARFISATTVVLVVLFWQRMEFSAHKRHMSTWPISHVRGKWRFIVTRYVVMRGGFLCLVNLAPLYLALPRPGAFLAVFFASLFAFGLIFLYLGHEEWIRCEEEYEINALRLAAEQTRFTKAIEN